MRTVPYHKDLINGLKKEQSVSNEQVIADTQAFIVQGRSQEFQKGVSINGGMSNKQGSVGVQFQMLMNRVHIATL